MNNFFLVDGKIVVEEEEKLLFHQVDFSLREHLSVSTPVLVLGGRVIEVFSGDNESRKENTMTSARHA